MLDILRKAKNANKKIARNSGGSDRISHACEIKARVVRSKMVGVGAKVVLIEMLLRYSETSLCERTSGCHGYLIAAFLIDET